jgi:hypothetical protein
MCIRLQLGGWVVDSTYSSTGHNAGQSLQHNRERIRSEGQSNMEPTAELISIPPLLMQMLLCQLAKAFPTAVP